MKVGTRPGIEDVLALTPLQLGLFSLAKLADSGLDVYTMQFLVDVDGPLDIARLRRSVGVLLERHPNLRVSFWDRNLPNPVQIVPTEVAVPWFEYDTATSEYDVVAESQRREPFDLGSGPALRIVLLTPPTGPRRMIVTAHHILMDGWSVAVFFTELVAVYSAGGTAARLPAVRPYRDYIGWLAGQDATAATRRWVDYLSRSSGPLMVSDGRAPVGVGAPETTRLAMPAADTARLTAWARDYGLTLNTVTQFAWAVVLSRLTDRRDVVFGTVVSGRPDTLPGVETMVGLFINTVPVAVDIDPTAGIVAQCAVLQRNSAAMRDFGYLSLSTVQQAVGRGTLFDTLFVFENAPLGAATQPVTTPDGTSFVPVAMESLAHYPLTVVAHLSDDELVVLVEAIPDALGPVSAADLGARLAQVLRSLPDATHLSPDRLDVLLPGEHLGTPPPPRPSDIDTVTSLFARQVRATPDAPALTTCGETYSYRALHNAAGRLAAELTACGVGPEDLVALALPRSARSIVAILAVLSTGAGYVPLDMSLPPARIDSILRQSKPALTLTDIEHRPALPAAITTLVCDDPDVEGRIAAREPVDPVVIVRPDHRAYVIFTSGSTGEPKGVMGTHRALVGYFRDHRDRVYRPAVADLGRPLRIAHAWSLSFDASWQPLIGLLAGHAVTLIDSDDMRDARRLVDRIAASGIDMIDTTPSMYAQLRGAGLDDIPLAVLALGGEAIGASLWQQLRALPGTTVYNCYGPTETTVEAVIAPVTLEPTPTIGTANADTAAYVLDSALRPTIPGVDGELYLSGVQLTRGYLGQPGLTAHRFVADPHRPGARMYRTGDLVRRNPSGTLGYHGRADDQVKIRGYRIELGEIETALRGLPGVTAAASVMLRGGASATLVSFAVGRDLPATQLRAALAERLPTYMVPTRVIVLPALPVTANGKLDIRALTKLAQDTLTAGNDGAAIARTDTERAVCAAFAALRHGPAPSLDDDFFDLGMDSIVAISLVNTLRKHGYSVSPRTVLTAPTVRLLATAIDTAAATAPAEAAEYGEVEPLPIVSWLYEHGHFRRFTQTTLIALPAGLERSGLIDVLQSLLDGHDMLRSQLSVSDAGPRLATRPVGTVDAAEILTRVSVSGNLRTVLTAAARAAMDRIDPATGTMVQAVWFDRVDADGVLLLTIHHLATDAVSWHILFADIANAATGFAPPPESTGYRRFARLLTDRIESEVAAEQRDYWIRQVAAADPVIGRRRPDPTTDTWSSLRVTASHTSVDTTATILAGLTTRIGMREFLLTALTITIASLRAANGQDSAAGTLVALEGHGREDDIVGRPADTKPTAEQPDTGPAPTTVDTARTVGWFTTVYPVRLGVGRLVDVDNAEANPAEASTLLESVARHVADVPHRGLDYGLLRYRRRVPALVAAPDPQIEFNYLGRFDLAGSDDGNTAQPWTPVTDLELNGLLPLDPEPNLPLRYTLDISAVVRATPDGPQLITNWRWSDSLLTASEADQLADLWRRAVTALAATLNRHVEHQGKRQR